MDKFEAFLRDIAPYVVVVGSFGRRDEGESSDIDCFLRSPPVEEWDPEDPGSDSYIRHIIRIADGYGFVWSSVIVGHIAVERQPGVPRMVEISSHYHIPCTETVFEREIYGVRMLCARDDKDTPLEDRYDFVDWDNDRCDNVNRHPLPPY